ncbi:MAG: phage integrase family protein [Planctomycetes bacterium]|nr:phage integrase family protein [Planctomycetota bacterium]
MFTPSNKGKLYPPEPLIRDEIQCLIRACSHRAPTGIRNRALIVTMYRGGLRVSEALSLERKDLDPQSGSIRILHGKGDKARTVGLDATAFDMIQRWLDIRSSLHISRGPLFCTLKGTRLSSAYVRKMLPRMALRAGIEKRVHAHGLRHTHAAELAAEGVPINVISRQLGHTNVGTTSRYIDHIAPQQVIETMRMRQWSISG